ncbi:MAG: hypothetical protein ABGY71_15195 [bacterium]|jgi:hypothetical protein|nr:hypothetical protein [Planctomycetota bacterium]HIL53129.1 hypothetical protein [Planctomycetota bacterium]
MKFQSTDEFPAEAVLQSHAPSPVLVLKRWNSWVQVWFPGSDETAWIDLGRESFSPLESDASQPSDPER